MKVCWSSCFWWNGQPKPVLGPLGASSWYGAYSVLVSSYALYGLVPRTIWYETDWSASIFVPEYAR